MLVPRVFYRFIIVLKHSTLCHYSLDLINYSEFGVSFIFITTSSSYLFFSLFSPAGVIYKYLPRDFFNLLRDIKKRNERKIPCCNTSWSCKYGHSVGQFNCMWNTTTLSSSRKKIHFNSRRNETNSKWLK